VKLNRKLSKTLNYDGSVGKLPRSLFVSRERDLIGQQACESIQFCELYAPKDAHTGFYRCVGSLTNSPLERPTNFVFDSKQLLGRMLEPQEDRWVRGSEVTDLSPVSGIASMDIVAQQLERRCFVVLMRGLPGHGKSHFSRDILTLWSETLKSHFGERLSEESLQDHCICISADDYMVGPHGETEFDPSLLPISHKRCQEKFREGLLAHKLRIESEALTPTLIVVDNTNTTPEEYAPYLSLAAQFDAELMVVEVDISFNDEVGLVPTLSCEKALHYSQQHGIHDVPAHALLRMWSR
jgi:hypothetical protein